MADEQERMFERFVGSAPLPADEADMLLNDVFQSFKKDWACTPFGEGQIIVPRPTAALVNRGRHIVLKVAAAPLEGDFDPWHPLYRVPLDIFVGTTCSEKHVHHYWAASFLFEPAAQIRIIGGAG